jgi:hypothetical protein
VLYNYNSFVEKKEKSLHKEENLMREYTKPVLQEEVLELKDCIAVSNDGNTTDGESGALEDIMGGILS